MKTKTEPQRRRDAEPAEKTLPKSAPAVYQVFVRYYGSTYIARCEGMQASCTGGPQFAAERAAKKHAARVHWLDPESCKLERITEGQYTATFTWA